MRVHWFFIVLMMGQACCSGGYFGPKLPRKRTRTLDSVELELSDELFMDGLAPHSVSPTSVAFWNNEPPFQFTSLSSSSSSSSSSSMDVDDLAVRKHQNNTTDFYCLPDSIIKVIASYLELPWGGFTGLSRYFKYQLFHKFEPIQELSARYGMVFSQLKAPEMLWLSQNRIPHSEDEMFQLVFVFALEKHLPGLEGPFIDFVFSLMKHNVSLRRKMATEGHPFFNHRTAASLLLGTLWKRNDFARIVELWDMFADSLLPRSLAELESLDIVKFICQNRPLRSIFMYFHLFNVNDMFFVVVEATRLHWSLALVTEFLIRSNAPTSNWLHFENIPGELLVAIQAIKVDKPLENAAALAEFIADLTHGFEPVFETLSSDVRNIFLFVRMMMIIRTSSPETEFDFSILPLHDRLFEFPFHYVMLACLQSGNRAAFLHLVRIFIRSFPGSAFVSVELRQSLFNRPEFVRDMLDDREIEASIPALFGNTRCFDGIQHKELFLKVNGIAQEEQLWPRADLSDCFIDFALHHLPDEEAFYGFLTNFVWPGASVQQLCLRMFDLRPEFLSELLKAFMLQNLKLKSKIPVTGITFKQIQILFQYAPGLSYYFPFTVSSEEALKVAELLDDFGDDELSCLQAISWPFPYMIVRLPHHLTIRKFVKRVLQMDLIDAVRSAIALFDGQLTDPVRIKAFLRVFESVFDYLKEADFNSFFTIIPLEVLSHFT